MFAWLKDAASSILRPFKRNENMHRDDRCLWSRDLEKHSHGEFSFAVVRANAPMEDYSQVVTGRHATFIGIYDGHGGPEASEYVSQNLSNNLLGLARASHTMSEEIIRTAFARTENGYMAFVGEAFGSKPIIAATGTCCLVGVIWETRIYVAHLGDSRAVMGCLVEGSKKITAEQLTIDHNVSSQEIRNELYSLHPLDSQIVVQRQGIWRLKGIIQISRAIGDAYLKRQEFALGPQFPKFHLPQPLHRPVMRADPDVLIRDLRPTDRFLIFASDGLWDLMTNQEAVEYVHKKKSRQHIARRLLCHAIKKAAKRVKMTHGDFKKHTPSQRRQYHDDISVVVAFIDHEMSDNNTSVADLSVQGSVNTVGHTNFIFS